MAGASVLTSYPSLVVKQDRASICEAVSEWDAPSTSQISDPRKAAEEVLFLEEESSRTCRNIEEIARSQFYLSNAVVSKLSGQTIARVHYPTCCTGMLYDFCPQGTKGSCCGIYDCCCLRPPFLFHQVNTSTGRAAEEADGSISTDIPAGVSLDEGTGAFLVSFPSTTILSATDRLLYLGAAWLIGDVFYKKSSSWEFDSCTCCSGGFDYSKMSVCSCRFCCR